MTASRLPDATHIGTVHLRVADLERVLGFYSRLLGLRAEHLKGGDVALHVGSATDPLLRLVAAPAAPPRPPGTTGLFHLALLVPERGDLAAVLIRLARARYPLQGLSNHGVSEALYLADPEGNGIEIYADTPRDAWPTRNGRLAMWTQPLDVDDLLTAPGERTGAGLPEGTRMGHVHLQVGDLAEAERFYADGIGFGPTVRDYPGALFLAAGGYHHHLGLNTWAGRNAPAPPAGALGLDTFLVRVPDAGTVRGVVERLESLGRAVEERDGVAYATDPAGIRVGVCGQ